MKLNEFLQNLSSKVFTDIYSDEEIEIPDVLTFIEKWLNINLTPVQRFIIKLMYGIELDNTKKDIIVYDYYKTKILEVLTEKEFLSYLWENEMINIDRVYKDGFLDILLVLGRRSGKTFMASLLSVYTFAKLLSYYSPHKILKVGKGNPIRIVSIGRNINQSKIAFSTIKMAISSSAFFNLFQIKKTAERIEAITREDYDLRKENATYTIRIEPLTCSTGGLRGQGTVFVLYDELAHFKTKTGRDIGEEVVKAYNPSVATYSQWKFTKRVYISTPPETNSGIFFNLYDKGMKEREKGKKPSILVIRLYSTLVNGERLNEEFLKSEERKFGSVYFLREYGALFLDTKEYNANRWLDEETIKKSMKSVIINKKQNINLLPHFVGIDIGIVKSTTVFCIVRLYENGVIEVVDIIDLRKKFGKQTIELNYIKDTLLEIEENYNIIYYCGDQYISNVIYSILPEKIKKKSKFIKFTEEKTYQMIKLIEGLFYNNMIYVSGKVDKILKKELESIYKIEKKSGRYLLVKIPTSIEEKQVLMRQKDRNDIGDILDAFFRAIWIAKKTEADENDILKIHFEESYRNWYNVKKSVKENFDDISSIIDRLNYYIKEVRKSRENNFIDKIENKILNKRRKKEKTEFEKYLEVLFKNE